MKRHELINLLKEKKSFLCVGLDTDFDKLPQHLKSEPDAQFAFNREIFDATVEFAPAYKINIAFYESLGVKGWKSLEKTVQYIRDSNNKVFLIADAKRGDIGNTSKQYARAFFEKEISGLDFDAVTVAPYMGIDSVTPFMEYEDKWVILLALTSNQGADDFQMIKSKDDKLLFEHVLKISATWGTPENTMYVVGATRAQMLETVRKYVPQHFLLIPGVGAQGGSLEDVVRYGMNNDVGLLVNVSRSIIFASSGNDFGMKARNEAEKIKTEMELYLRSAGFLHN